MTATIVNGSNHRTLLQQRQQTSQYVQWLQRAGVTGACSPVSHSIVINDRRARRSFNAHVADERTRNGGKEGQTCHKAQSEPPRPCAADEQSPLHSLGFSSWRHTSLPPRSTTQSCRRHASRATADAPPFTKSRRRACAKTNLVALPNSCQVRQTLLSWGSTHFSVCS